jgi:predicted transcriptional regulator
MSMPTSEKKVGVSATISKDLKEELEQISKEKDRSFSYLVSVALKEYVEKQKKSQNEDEKSSG